MGRKATTLLSGTSNSQDTLAAQYQLIDYVSKQFFVRRLVSQKRRRMLVGGYDLDMSYITPCILSMSFPAEQMKAIYRNPMWQVKDVLEMRHREHYKVGKDWTGLMVSSYLVYTGMSAEEAMQIYADKRTTNNLGVTIPSQRLYVHYWQKSLTFPDGCPPNVCLPEPSSRVLQRIRSYDTINIESIFIVLEEMEVVPGQRYRPSEDLCRCFCKKISNLAVENIHHFYSFIEEDHEGNNSEIEASDEKNLFDCYLIIRQSRLLEIYVSHFERNIGGRLFFACFNTAFIENNLLKLSLSELEKVGNKAKSIPGHEFHVEFLFGTDNPNDGGDGCNSNC